MLSVEDVEPLVGVVFRRALNETDGVDPATDAPTGDVAGGGGEAFVDPTTAPVPSPTPAPVTGGFVELEDEAKEAFENLGFVVLGIILAISVCAIWRFWVCCRNRRERRMLQLASARADNVLGDMQVCNSQLVPTQTFVFVLTVGARASLLCRR